MPFQTPRSLHLRPGVPSHPRLRQDQRLRRRNPGPKERELGRPEQHPTRADGRAVDIRVPKRRGCTDTALLRSATTIDGMLHSSAQRTPLKAPGNPSRVVIGGEALRTAPSA